jgi:hypothetical protein
VGLDNIGDVVRILNLSSRERTFEYCFDVARFLATAQMWNLSYGHSWVGYCRAEAAGVVLNAVDPPSREAYSAYWGVLPDFRRQGVLSELYGAYLGQFRREGYLRVHGDAHADSPWPLFDKLGWRRGSRCFQMEAAKPRPGPAGAACVVRPLDAAELARQWPEEGPARCWTGARAFLRNAGQAIEILGAFRRGDLQAYCVATALPGHTLLLHLDQRPAYEGASRQLIGHIAENRPAPYSAYMAPDGSAFHAALSAAGFAATREIAAITLDLV